MLTKEIKEKKPKFKIKYNTAISIKSCVTVISLLVALLAVTGLLSYVIPQGAFERDPDGMIVANTYSQGTVDGIDVWRVVTAPIRVFASEDALTVIMISVFLLIMSGVFELLDKTNGTKVVIGRLIHRLADKGAPVVCLCVLVFMLFGSFFGMFEELVTLLPLITTFMLSMGMDTMIGLGVCLLAACFGFSAAITNPFSVGLAAQKAETSIQDGIWLRIVFFVLIYISLCSFLMIYLKKIERNPELSLTYKTDVERRKSVGDMQNLDFKSVENVKIFKVFTTFFLVQLVILILIASIRSISGLAIPILAISFLFTGLICGLIVTKKKIDTFKYIANGALSMLPAVVMIALASSVKLVMTESGIMDTIMHYTIDILEGKSRFVTILLIYLLILVLQVFIGSSSAKIMLVIPLIVPICASIGISPAMVILTYCMADGFSDVILPTNPVLLVGLSMANVSYTKWFKWTWKLQLFVLTLTFAILGFATLIGY